jgi:sterol desaturase/sphingolipid hydroxylase (fatty acid hydroxylase superfamily)
MIGIPLGLLVANAGEWVIHKYMLHGLGRHRESYWSFHWHDHHRTVRRNGYLDENYRESVFKPGGKAKEAAGLLTAAAAVSPLLPVAPFFVATVWASTMGYYVIHRNSHMNPEWGRKWAPWHYDHHMGPDQDANWCVTFPLFDHIMGTRIPYAGTEREAQDIAKAAARRAMRAQQASEQEPDVAPENDPATEAA